MQTFSLRSMIFPTKSEATFQNDHVVMFVYPVQLANLSMPIRLTRFHDDLCSLTW